MESLQQYTQSRLTRTGAGGRLPGRLHQHRHVAPAGLKQPQHVIQSRVGSQLRRRAHLEVAHSRVGLLVHQDELLYQYDADELLPAAMQEVIII